MNTQILQAVLRQLGTDNPDTMRRIRAAVPELSEQCAELLTGDCAPCAMIGAPDVQREYGKLDRNAIDASAEREGMAADWLEAHELSGRPNNGRSTCQWDYQRALRRAAILDNDKAAKLLKARYPYARHAAREAWQKVLAHYGTCPVVEAWPRLTKGHGASYHVLPPTYALIRGRAVGGDVSAPLPDNRISWLRDESVERRDARTLHRARRQIIRLLGALAQAGNVRAREVYAKLVPGPGASNRKRR